jgi:hypothetical protein
VIGHGGGVLGFSSSLLCDEAEGRASVLLINSSGVPAEVINGALLNLT